MSNNINKENNANNNNNNNNAKKNNNNDNNSKSSINKNSKKNNNNNNSNRSNNNKNNKNKIENENKNKNKNKNKKQTKFPQQKQLNIQESQRKSTVVDNENSIGEVEKFRESLDIREKRIGIVFKVIYVIAIFFGALFLELGKLFGQGLNDAYILEASAASFLLVMIGYTVLYIINEMECLKLNSKYLAQSQVEITERSYSQIFTNLRISGFVLVLGSNIVINYVEKINNVVLINAFYISLILWGAIWIVRSFIKSVSIKKLLLGISCAMVMAMIMSLFFLVGLKTLS